MSSLLDSWDGRKYTCLFLIILVFMVVIYVKGRRELMFNSSSRPKTHVRIGLHNYEQTTHGQASCSYLGKLFHHLNFNSLETGDELGLVFVSSFTGSYRFVNPSMTAIDVLGESFSILLQL